jgi:dipeptidase E
MKLILCGGGSEDQVKESYEIFAKEVKGGKVLYIPLAWNHGNMENCIDWLKGELLPYGITNIEDVLDAKEITKEKLAKCSGVFIGGGNTFKLLKMLKETDAFDNLNEFLNNGGIIMGGSAGALIFGKSIDTCLKTELNISSTDENLVGLKDTSGFNKIKGYSLFVHYKRKPEQNEQTLLNINRLLKDGHKLICLPEETSVWINNNEIKIIGQNPAEIFDGTNVVIANHNDIIL